MKPNPHNPLKTALWGGYMEKLGKTLIAIFCVIVLVIAVSVVWSLRGDENKDVEEEGP